VRWVRQTLQRCRKHSYREFAQVGKTQTHECLELRVTFRPPDQYGHLPITATLINTHPIKNVPWEEISARCFFQCEMTVTAGSDTTLPPFVERRSRDTDTLILNCVTPPALSPRAFLCSRPWLRGGLSPRSNDAAAQDTCLSLHPTARCLPAGSPTDLEVPSLPLFFLQMTI